MPSTPIINYLYSYEISQHKATQAEELGCYITFIKQSSFRLIDRKNVTTQAQAHRLLAHRLVSTPLGAQPPRWHLAQCLALIPFVTTQAHR